MVENSPRFEMQLGVGVFKSNSYWTDCTKWLHYLFIIIFKEMMYEKLVEQKFVRI